MVQNSSPTGIDKIWAILRHTPRPPLADCVCNCSNSTKLTPGSIGCPGKQLPRKSQESLYCLMSCTFIGNSFCLLGTDVSVRNCCKTIQTTLLPDLQSDDIASRVADLENPPSEDARWNLWKLSAMFAAIAYEDANHSFLGEDGHYWEHLATVENAEWTAKAIIFRTHTNHSMRAVLSFRGTASWSLLAPDWKLGNLMLWQESLDGYYVHMGFLRNVNALKDSIFHELNALGPIDRLLITGHSKGGAMAAIAAYQIVTNRTLDIANISVVTFGQPPVSDMTFTTALENFNVKFDRVIAQGSSWWIFNFLRIDGGNWSDFWSLDPVPSVLSYITGITGVLREVAEFEMYGIPFKWVRYLSFVLPYYEQPPFFYLTASSYVKRFNPHGIDLYLSLLYQFDYNSCSSGLTRLAILKHHGDQSSIHHDTNWKKYHLHQDGCA